MLSTRSDELIKNYTRDGFIHLPGLFTDDEVLSCQRESDRLLGLDLVHPDNGRTPFRFGASDCPERIDPVCDISPLYASLCEDPRLIDLVTVLFADQAQLFKDKLILKAPGVAGYQPHQDWAWGWQDLCPANDILSISIQIDGADAENGGLILYPGYHHKLYTPPGERMNFSDREKAFLDEQDAIRCHKAGDVLIFHSLTPHRSNTNKSRAGGALIPVDECQKGWRFTS